jgi:peroxiredoxin Q/BCP
MNKERIIALLVLLLLVIMSGCAKEEPKEAEEVGQAVGIIEKVEEQKEETIERGTEMVKLEVGDVAPGFSLLDQDENEVSLSGFSGKKVLLYFYPKADMPGCTKQACSVRDSSKELVALGVVGIGMSPDEPTAQKKFDEKYDLGFQLLSDADHAIAEAYGAWGEKVRAGKTSMGIIRSSFLIDEEGKLAGVWYAVKPDETVPNATAAIGQ